jgi:DNA helicase-2/ATP-dependent DNA helicase PcrA
MKDTVQPELWSVLDSQPATDAQPTTDERPATSPQAAPQPKTTPEAPAAAELTPEQRSIVEWDEGPAVVIAGAGTGKTRVIVERVKWLLESKPDLLPEQILVLTYNVKAARELADRIEEAVGPATKARITVSNFHSFCHRILTETAAEADMPANPDVLDGVGQLLLVRELRPSLDLVYHGPWAYAEFVKFINRAKDELVTPADFERFVEKERQVFEDRYGSYADAAARLATAGYLKPVRAVRADYARVRIAERAEERSEAPEYNPGAAAKTADKEARRTLAGTGEALTRGRFTPEQQEQIDELARTYVEDGAALEVMRLAELAAVYRAYEGALAERGALDFGAQIARVTQLFKLRPNVLRRWQRQYRHILVDEFQDANIAQIELIEMLGRTPDRPDNVMVVGDDDQSIYRFRGASFAAFKEFDRRFSQPPAHDPGREAPGPPTRLRLEQNFRSVGRVLEAANRLIGLNKTRFEPDKRLWSARSAGPQVELVVCGGAEDEAVAIVDAIRRRVGGDRAAGGATGDGTQPRWSDAAVLYRKHKHREAIVARLREEDIPYTVVGGLSLFAMPEIRDLEQALRAIANPEDDVAVTRLMTAGPWRLDALEILRVTNVARFDLRQHLIEVVQQLVADGETSGEASELNGQSRAVTVTVQPATRAKLRRMLNVLNELSPRTWREGPHTLLLDFLEWTGQVLDLLAAGTPDAHRGVANIGSLLRFAADWQQAHPKGTLGGFVDYLDAYQEAGGELPTSVELSEDVQGVRLMTLYQAKGLEFPHVFIPQLLEDEWPTKEGWSGFFPPELLRERIEGEDLHAEEERRLLYVAMTRARETLMLTTWGGPTAIDKAASRFVNEICGGHGDELLVVDRANSWAPVLASDANGAIGNGTDAAGEADPAEAAMALARRVMPLPTRRERRLALRVRASELVGLMEGTDTTNHPEAAAARAAFAAELAAVGELAAKTADEVRAAGLDPLTLREVALDSGAGAKLLDVVPLPATFSYSALRKYETCPMQYAFAYVYRIPPPPDPVAAFAFGDAAHEAFEAFTRERRERLARGEEPPTREDLERLFRERWVPIAFGDRPTEEAYQRRAATMLANFWGGELSTLGRAEHEELTFQLVIDDPAGGPAVIVTGSIDRIDRLPSGGIEVIDYKTGRQTSQKELRDNLQLSIYALACRDALGLGTPEKVTLYFTESATRMSTTCTDADLDAARADILARTARIRSGDFAATPSAEACRRCDYARLCPSRI